MARVPRLSTTFKRSLDRLGVAPRTSAFRAVFATVGALANAQNLPGSGDIETSFVPGCAYVRRVEGQNVWLLYRFDHDHVAILTARDVPPTPID